MTRSPEAALTSAAAATKQRAAASLRAGRLDEAEQLCRAALGVAPNDPQALYLLGLVLLQRDRCHEAAEVLSHATRAAPDGALVFNALGVALDRLRRHADAARAFRRALSLKGNFAAACRNLGAALMGSGDRAGARAALERAIALDPLDAHAHDLAGAVLMAEGDTQAAIVAYQRALELNPRLAEAHFNLGNAVRALGQMDEAAARYGAAIAAQPGFAAAYANRAYVNLLLGRFAQGWLDYEWRVRARGGADYLTRTTTPGGAYPRPSSLLPFEAAGKRVFVVSDQGLGDDLFFLRFAPVLRQRGAQLTHAASPRLHGMLERTDAADRLIAEGPPPEDVDCVTLTGDLALLCGCATAADIPLPLRLTAETGRVDALQRELAARGSGPWLGITWRAGNPAPVAGRLKLVKEITLDELAPAVAAWPGNVAVLQRDPQQSELEAISRMIGGPVHDFSRCNEDLEDMLALLAVIDEYVGVSNTNMHLRAGLGRRGRVLIPHPPEWRWLLSGSESPWFPGFPLYRADERRGWQDAVARVSADLAATRGTP